MNSITDIQLAELPYKFDDLKPYISEETLRLHYNKHNKNYVDTLNKLKKGTSYDRLTLEEIIINSVSSIEVLKDKQIFNNASQAWNHAFYWQCLSATHNSKPSESLIEVLSRAFRSLSGFKEQFSNVGLDQFGSGWVWLVENNRQNLEIISTSNADSPLVLGLRPLLLCDVWEHAYYLDYKNDRKAYLENYWPLVNWRLVERRLSIAASPREICYDH